MIKLNFAGFCFDFFESRRWNSKGAGPAGSAPFGSVSLFLIVIPYLFLKWP